MRTPRNGKTDPEQAKSEMWLGRCLVEGDLEATSSARRSRRKTFGVSLAVEILLLGLLVAAPFLSSVVRPQIHQTFAPSLAYFDGRRQHSPAQPAGAPAPSQRPQIPNPFQQPPISAVTAYVRGTEELGEVSTPNLPGEPCRDGLGTPNSKEFPHRLSLRGLSSRRGRKGGP